MTIHKLLQWLLNIMTIGTESQTVVGDFEEEYKQLLKEKGYFKALNWYAIQVLISIIPFTKIIILKVFMLANSYIKVGQRNLVKNKLTSFINIFGFSTSLATCLFSYIFVMNMMNSDKFHENYNNIYMVVSYNSSGTGEIITGRSPLPLGQALSNEFPQIKKYTKLAFLKASVESRGRNFEEAVTLVDKEFFNIFTFPLKAGSINDLNNEDWVVITSEFGNKYFGNVNPIGKELLIHYADNSKSFKVSGVIEEYNRFSSLKPDIIIPFTGSNVNENQYDWSQNISATFF